MADRTYHNSAQQGTKNNGGTGQVGPRGGGTSGQTETRMNGHYGGGQNNQNKRNNGGKRNYNRRMGHNRGGMMQQVSPHYAHQYPEQHYGQHFNHYGQHVQYPVIQNQFFHGQIQPQHIIRNPSPLQQQQQQQQNTQPTQAPTNQVVQQQPAQPNQSPQQQPTSTVPNSQSPSQLVQGETVIEDTNPGSTNSNSNTVQRSHYVIQEYNGMQPTSEYTQNQYIYAPTAHQYYPPPVPGYPADQNQQQQIFSQYQQYPMYHPHFMHQQPHMYAYDQNQGMQTGQYAQYAQYAPQVQPQFYPPQQVDPSQMVTTPIIMNQHSQNPQPTQIPTSPRQIPAVSPAGNPVVQPLVQPAVNQQSSPSVPPVSTVPKQTLTQSIGQITNQNPPGFVPGLPSIVNGKQPEELKQPITEPESRVNIEDSPPLEIQPRTAEAEKTVEIETTQEDRPESEPMVVENGTNEKPEIAEEDEKPEVIEEPTNLIVMFNSVAKPEEPEKQNDEEQHGTFEFNVPDIDDDSNDELMLTEATSIEKLCFMVERETDIPVLSDEEEKLVQMPTFNEYKRSKTDSIEVDDNIQLDKSLEFVNSALENAALDEDVPNVSFGMEEIKPEEVQPEKSLPDQPDKVAEKIPDPETEKVETKENAKEKVQRPKMEPKEELPKDEIKAEIRTEVPEEKIKTEKRKEEPEKPITEKPIPVKVIRPGQVVSPVISPVVASKTRASIRKSIGKVESKDETPKESKSAASLVNVTTQHVTNQPSQPSTSSSMPQLVELAPAAPTPSLAPPAKPTWASMMKARKSAQAAQIQPVKKTVPLSQNEGTRIEKKENQIEVDPIAKKITDIIYSEDNTATELGIPRGLINHANNCWVNSLLQTALVCDPLYKLLKKLLFYTQSTTPGKNEMEIAKIGTEIKRMLPTCAKLAEVFGEILHQKDAQRMAYEPTGVYDRISELNSDLAEGQHDAEEALSLLLNAMHDEIVTVRKAAGQSTKPESGDAGFVEERKDQDGEWKMTTKSGRVMKSSVTCTSEPFEQSSPISEGFRGLSHSSIKISGNHSSPPPTEQPFFTLQLDVASPLSRNIDDVIKNIPKEENLEDYKLKDGTVVTANRKMSLARLPPILILHMKRFLYNATTNRVEKLDKHITIKERIEIPRECLSPGLRDKIKKNPRYELNGLVLHHGIGAEGGHYTAETKRNSKWFRVDDNKVNEVKINDVINCDPKRTPYLLFYKKVQ